MAGKEKNIFLGTVGPIAITLHKDYDAIQGDNRDL